MISLGLGLSVGGLVTIMGTFDAKVEYLRLMELRANYCVLAQFKPNALKGQLANDFVIRTIIGLAFYNLGDMLFRCTHPYLLPGGRKPGCR